MAKVLEGIDLRDLIDLEAQFGTVLGGPAGSARRLFPPSVQPGAAKRKKGFARKGNAKIRAKKLVRFRLAKAAKDAIVPPRKK